MADRDKFYTGSDVSRHLPAGERSFDQVVLQAGHPVLDADLNLPADIGQEVGRLLRQWQHPSGWLRGQTRFDAYSDFDYQVPADGDFVANSFKMAKRTAVVAGMPVVVEYTNTATAEWNVIQLDAPPVYGGSAPDVKRTDFVFLEVWRVLVSRSPRASGTVQTVVANMSDGETVTVAGTVLTARAASPGADEFLIGANDILTAANLATAIGTYVATVTAAANGTDTVTVKAATPGAAGNAITLATSDGTAFVLSGATLAGGSDTANKPAQNKLYRHGNVNSLTGQWLDDDIEDATVGTETSKRVQVQYRIRTTGQTIAVNHKTQPEGFSNTAILGQGAQSSPVASYPFVKADKTSTSGNSSAVSYDTEDPGLWISGDGSSTAASALGTVDGFVYAIPLCFVFRRNDAYNGGAGSGFNPQTNTNGALPSTHTSFVNPQVGTAGSGESDRPDKAFSDAINSNDVLDLRKHVAPPGLDFAAELQYQMQSLLDGQLATWAVDAADKQTLGSGSGDVSAKFLVCNQLGRDTTHGGNNPISGSTTRGDTIRNFDHVARRFADQAVVERVVFEFAPSYVIGTTPGKYVTQTNGAWNGWGVGDVLNLDLTELNASTMGAYDPANATFTGPGPGHNASIMDFAPPGTMITDVLGAWHDDGHFTTPVNQATQFSTITGMGTGHLQLTLDANTVQVNGGDSGNSDHAMVGTSSDVGSQRRIFVEVELSYPLGAGITDTPDVTLTPDAAPYPRGPILENDTTQRPADMETLLAPTFREGFREVGVEYVANDPSSGFGSGTPITDSFVSRNSTSLYPLRRIYGSGALLTGVTDSVASQAHDVDVSLTEYGSSSRLVRLDTSGGSPSKDPLSGAGQTLCSVTYFAQDPVPNYGASGGGYQVGVYFRTNAPQTAGTRNAPMSEVPDPLTVEPLVMSNNLWTGQVSMGSVDLPFPYVAPLDQIAVNDNATSTFPGEWYFAATSSISITDFNAETGLLNLHGMVPVDGTGSFTFSSKAKDIEFRAMYKVADTNAYRPTVFSQNLSGVVRHKVFMPFLARSTTDTLLYRKNEVLLVVISRWAELDDENTIRFVDTDNRSCAAVYRTRNLLLTVGS